MKALPTKQRIHRLNSEDERISLSLSDDLGIKKLPHPIVSIDLGTLANKNGLLKEPTLACVTKVENFLTKVENQPRTSNKKGSFAARNKRAPAAELTVTWCGQTWALGKHGIISGGSTNLDGDKTEELEVVLRVLFALTLYELGKQPNEKVHLSIAMPFFESAKLFERKEEKIRNAIKPVLNWGTSDGARSISIAGLKVDPEDYHAELFSRLYSLDLPNFEDEDRATLGIGFRTFNQGIITADGYYDVVRSNSYDNKGTSLFYKWAGEELGINDWANAQFIAAINRGDKTYRPQGSDEVLDLSEAVSLARGWYLDELVSIIKKNTPSEINKFVVCGGGGLMFGKELASRLWGSTIICPEADIANAAGQLIEMALEL